jgi:hypothetical protein
VQGHASRQTHMHLPSRVGPASGWMNRVGSSSGATMGVAKPWVSSGERPCSGHGPGSFSRTIRLQTPDSRLQTTPDRLCLTNVPTRPRNSPVTGKTTVLCGEAFIWGAKHGDLAYAPQLYRWLIDDYGRSRVRVSDFLHSDWASTTPSSSSVSGHLGVA